MTFQVFDHAIHMMGIDADRLNNKQIIDFHGEVRDW